MRSTLHGQLLEVQAPMSNEADRHIPDDGGERRGSVRDRRRVTRTDRRSADSSHFASDEPSGSDDSQHERLHSSSEGA
jgi:hypothetical protein